jgi:hypothetical protein
MAPDFIAEGREIIYREGEKDSRHGHASLALA